MLSGRRRRRRRRTRELNGRCDSFADLALAEWIERRGAEMGVHGLVGTIASGKPGGGSDRQAQVSAELLALEIWNSPTLSLRPNPIWLNGADSILELLQCSPHNHFATLDEQCKQES